ncbi:MAG: hypothetical protein HC840_16370 [Leptolyngbyaceae cyanobacterium RM2_2_4]|nr:hypothetical protein [Leptolyngbyaceae cyanobacterium SM1_4_3]NJN55996.1 hypothetical protein [Leptolyngbyaceae cyanobacterium SL_5_9]NJO50755.1 hypothetical protein [Leptolyngbyaceae cyanobacterium RM2_2_4]
MTTPLQRFVLPAAMLSGAIFSAATLPLVVLGSEPVDIHLEDEPVFSGEVKDLAAPYLGIATVMSLGMGVATISALGWSQASRKSAEAEDQVSSLARDLQEKEAQIEALQFSEKRLHAAGLQYFLQDEVDEVNAQPIAAVPAMHQVRDAEDEDPTEPLEKAIASGKFDTNVQASKVATHPSAQAFSGYAQPTQVIKQTVASVPQSTHTAEPKQVNELLDHLKQVMAQIEQLQTVGTLPANSLSPVTVSYNSGVA